MLKVYPYGIGLGGEEGLDICKTSYVCFSFILIKVLTKFYLKIKRFNIGELISIK